MLQNTQHVELKPTCNSIVPVYMVRLHVIFSKHTGTHVCRTVQLTIQVASTRHITLQHKYRIPSGESVHTGQ